MSARTLPKCPLKYEWTSFASLVGRTPYSLEVLLMDYEKLSANRVGESSDTIRKRVQAVRDFQNQHFSKNGLTEIVCNADMRVEEIHQFCQVEDEGRRLMRAAMNQLNLSGGHITAS